MSNDYDPIIYISNVIRHLEEMRAYHKRLINLCANRITYTTKNSISNEQSVIEHNMHIDFVSSLNVTLRIYYRILSQLKNSN